MADDEDYDQPQVAAQQAVVHRPERRIQVREHDTPKDQMEAIIELAGVVLDKLAAQNAEQLKNNAASSDVAAVKRGAESAGSGENEAAGSAVGPGASSPCAGSSHKDVATLLKRMLDETYGGTWHVIVGSSFGGNVTNDGATLVNFTVEGVHFLVFRSGPPDRPAALNEEEQA